MSRLLELFRPDMRVVRVSDIDVASLKASGYEAMMLDLDNTLLPWKSSDMPAWSRDWVESAKQCGMKLCIVSNTHNPARLARIAGELGVESVCRALKPRSSGFERAARALGVQPEQAVVVGDQLLTDILGGNLACMYTVLVKPIHHREFVGTKLSRLVERLIFALMRREERREQTSRMSSQKEQDSK